MDLPTDLPEGVVLTPLVRHDDHRGSFAEIFRASWPTAVEPIQWNVVASRAHVLRGFHVHVRHRDYLVVVAGRMRLHLKDLRGTVAGPTLTLDLAADAPVAVSVPTGVGHGFYFPEPTTHVYSVSEYWNTADELACRWDDPDLALPALSEPPLLSPRDRDAGSLAAMIADYRRLAAGARP